MKDTLKAGVKIFGKIVLANVLSIITVISISFLCNVMFTKDIGYYAYGTTSDSSESTLLYEHNYSDGEDKKLVDYEEQGYVVSQIGKRSPMSASGNVAFIILTALFTLPLGGMLCYTFVWKEGNRDLNLVRYGRMKENKYKGVYIGLIASAPSLILLLVLGIGKWAFAKSFPVVLYQYLNSVFYAPIDLICGKALNFGELAIWQLLLLILVQLIIPIFTGIAYYIGYKDILISEKFIYKKEK